MAATGDERRRTFSSADVTKDPAQYAAYLSWAREQLGELRRKRDELMALAPGDQVLDIGCGTGDALREFAPMVAPNGRAVGIDASEAMIAEAQQRSAACESSLEFVICDAHALDFADDTFDVSRAARVFQHLDNPQRALAEAIRVTKPGGRILIGEADHEMTAIDAADRATTRAIRASWIDGLRSGWIARQLYGLMQRAGLRDLRVVPMPTIFTDFGAFSALFALEGEVQNAVRGGVVTDEAASAWMADLRERDAAGCFFACAVSFTAIGRKPPR